MILHLVDRFEFFRECFAFWSLSEKLDVFTRGKETLNFLIALKEHHIILIVFSMVIGNERKCSFIVIGSLLHFYLFNFDFRPWWFTQIKQGESASLSVYKKLIFVPHRNPQFMNHLFEKRHTYVLEPIKTYQIQFKFPR